MSVAVRTLPKPRGTLKAANTPDQAADVDNIFGKQEHTSWPDCSFLSKRRNTEFLVLLFEIFLHVS
jgi:hypothetical protein